MKFTKPIIFTVGIRGDWAYGAVFPAPSSGFAITMTTSYGNFGYIWTHPGDDHMGFLKSLSRDYAMGKLVDDHITNEFNQDKTERNVKDMAEQIYSDQPEKLAEAMDTIREFFEETYRTSNEYCIAASSGLMPFPFREHEDIYPTETFKLGLTHFWEKLWPTILVQIEAGLEA